MISIIPLESFGKHPQAEAIKAIMIEAVKYFPELEGQAVYLGVCDVLRHEDNIASCDIENSLIRFSNQEQITFVTVFHELMHIVQYQNKFPRTEESCSVHAMARMPEELIDSDCIPYLGTGDRKTNGIVCRNAIAYKNSGKRNYISYAMKALEKMNENKNQ